MEIPPEKSIMYLSFDQWSPRFDASFYSFKMPTKELHASPPSEATTSSNVTMGGNHNHPAWYYKVQVFSENRSHSLLRRYSQFRWLYDEIRSHPPQNEYDYTSAQQPISCPPKTCPFYFQSEEFAQNRLEQLQDFLKDVLQRPGYSTHPAIFKFLELERFDKVKSNGNGNSIN